jgi:hypothetical protein
LDHEKREMSEKRETVRADLHYVIPRLAVDIASGRAAGFIFSTSGTVFVFCLSGLSIPSYEVSQPMTCANQSITTAPYPFLISVWQHGRPAGHWHWVGLRLTTCGFMAA